MNIQGIEVEELEVEELTARPVAPQTLAGIIREEIHSHKAARNLADRVRAARLAGANLEVD